MSVPKLMLDYVYDHEAAQPDHVVLVQPVGAGHVIEYTWRRMLDESRRMARHLESLKFEPGARIALLSKNCAHCIVAELAIWMAGGTTVALFPNEAPETLRGVLERCDARLLFVGKLDDAHVLTAAVPPQLPCIALPLAPPVLFETWDAIVARTPPLTGRPARQPDDLAMLLYTSGTTGKPKGVMHNFAGITRATEHLVSDRRDKLPMGDERRALSYLPLAHAYERAVLECRLLMEGQGCVFFTESTATFADDLRRARPTVFFSVPRLWLKLQESVLRAVPQPELDALLADPSTREETARRVLGGLGLDHVQFAITGSAPMKPALLEWFRDLGLNLLEGYGMSEDFAYSHRATGLAHAAGYVGPPCPGVDVRIDPSGEVLIRSPGQFVGYFKNPELSAACFTADGFFRTGDLGERRADGQLKITGRMKDLFKTSKGKYIAPAPIEQRLNAHPMVENSIVAGSGQAAPFAVVLLAEGVRSRLDDATVQARVNAELTELRRNVNETLAAYERLHTLVIAHDVWSIENGCLTPTLKIKRGSIEARLRPDVERWYGEQSPVVWA